MNKKFLVWIIPVIFVLAIGVRAQQTHGSIEIQTQIQSRKVYQVFGFYASRQLDKKVRWSTWGGFSKYWSQVYGGLNYSVKPWLDVTGGLSIEKGRHPIKPLAGVVFHHSLHKWLNIYGGVNFKASEKPWNIMGGANIGKDNWSGGTFYVHGQGYYWYKNRLSYKITKTFALGVFTQRAVRPSPYFEKHLTKKLFLWGSYVGNVHKPQGIVGLKVSF